MDECSLVTCDRKKENPSIDQKLTVGLDWEEPGKTGVGGRRSSSSVELRWISISTAKYTKVSKKQVTVAVKVPQLSLWVVNLVM